MNPKFDVKCESCGHIFEEEKQFKDPESDCPECGSSFTKTLLTGFRKAEKAKDPYDYLNGRIPSKPIKSFANDKRKGGKDTT